MTNSAPAAACTALVFVAACGLSPIDHRIKLGEEPFVVFVGEGIDQHTDLFTTTTGGGSVFQLTFTPVIERAPALSASGGMVAFLRMKDSLPGTKRQVVVMNLQNGAEKAVAMPGDVGTPQRLAWGSADSLLYIRTDKGLYQASMPPTGDSARSVPEAQVPLANRSYANWLGSPAFAEAIPCNSGLCIVGPKLDTTPLNSTGHDAMRWGADSVAWFEGDEIVVRALGAGHARRMNLKDGPHNPRDGSRGGG